MRNLIARGRLKPVRDLIWGMSGKITESEMNMSEELERLKKKYGGDFCECQYFGMERGVLTPLHVYARYEELELAKKALAEGADVNAIDDNGETPIFSAINMDILNLFLEHGADINAKDDDGDTPLISAAYTDDMYDVIAKLIENGADINAENNDGITAFDEACFHRNLNLMSIFKKHNARNGSYVAGLPKLHQSVLCNDIEMALALLDQGEDPNSRDGENRTPLHRAATAAIAEILIQNGSDVDARDSDGETPLYLAIQDFGYKENIELAALLVSKGADVNFSEEDGSRLLQSCESVQMAEILIDNGAILNSADDEGFTPLHCAVQTGKPDLVSLYLKHSAQIDARENDGKTPLHCLTCGGDMVGVAKVLLDAGAEINAVDNDGNTVIHDLAYYNAEEKIKFLISRGADTEIKNNAGKTPLDIAVENDSQDVVKLLSG